MLYLSDSEKQNSDDDEDIQNAKEVIEKIEDFTRNPGSYTKSGVSPAIVALIIALGAGSWYYMKKMK